MHIITNKNTKIKKKKHKTRDEKIFAKQKMLNITWNPGYGQNIKKSKYYWFEPLFLSVVSVGTCGGIEK